MSTAENKAIARRYIEEIWNSGNLEVAHEIITAAFIFRGPTGKVEGLEAFKQYVAAIRTTFPDIHFTTDDLVAERDEVVVCWTMTGSHTSEFMGIAATGKHFMVPGVSILRLSGGKVAEARLYWDRLSLLEQFGAVPMPG